MSTYEHAVRIATGRKGPVYLDDGDEYILVDGDVVYLHPEAEVIEELPIEEELYL